MGRGTIRIIGRSSSRRGRRRRRRRRRRSNAKQWEHNKASDKKMKTERQQNTKMTNECKEKAE